jgi:hypothetical protein
VVAAASPVPVSELAAPEDSVAVASVELSVRISTQVASGRRKKSELKSSDTGCISLAYEQADLYHVSQLRTSSEYPVYQECKALS